MKIVIQRVTEASVTAEGRQSGAIGRGFLVLLGIGERDTREDAERLVSKMIRLRIFADQQGKTNLSLQDVGGALLVVSQFTLYADCHKGNRPNFLQAAAPDQAEALYEYFLEVCRRSVPQVEQGVFGARMEVRLVNDGPFTVILE